jgi:hypothetical protein
MTRNDQPDGTESPADVLARLRASRWTRADLKAVPEYAALLDEEDQP